MQTFMTACEGEGQREVQRGGIKNRTRMRRWGMFVIVFGLYVCFYFFVLFFTPVSCLQHLTTMSSAPGGGGREKDAIRAGGGQGAPTHICWQRFSDARSAHKNS